VGAVTPHVFGVWLLSCWAFSSKSGEIYTNSTTGVAPKSGGASEWKVKGSPKKFPNSEAPVHLYEKTVSGKDLDKVEGMSQFSADRKDETWFCRRSCHRNSTEKRTASWAEFVHSFKEHHAQSEEAFTPTVIGAREAMRWDASGIDVQVHGGHWTNITVAVEEMKHKIDPKPLKNRTFPVVQGLRQITVRRVCEGQELGYGGLHIDRADSCTSKQRRRGVDHGNSFGCRWCSSSMDAELGCPGSNS
jgi:hypothetical protein